MLVFDDINFSPTDDRVCKVYGARDVLVIVPSNNGVCTKVPVDYERNDPESVLIAETSGVIVVYMGDFLDSSHVLYGLVGTFHFPVDS